jgi:vacuole morphology and inheritance protein 14
LQLLEPARYPQLLKTLYGLLMLLPQQSSAFKILRTRLKTVPAYTFMPAPPQSSSSEFPGLSAIRRTASTGAYTQILSHIPSIPSVSHLSQPSDDGDSSSDMSNGAVGINFSMQLKQFEHMQHQHRLHRVTQPQTKVPHKPPIAPVQVCFS